MNDKQLRQNILDELDFDPSIDAANIGVAVDDGVVTLSGHVGSYIEKVAVEDAVRNASGVRAIAENIEVRFPHTKKVGDDEIAKRALSILKWCEVLPDSDPQVTVENGWITLEGKAPWQYQRASAEQAIRKLNGIVGITNRIAVVPTVSPGDVKGKIEKALKRRSEDEARGIKVSINDGNIVMLEGKVRTWNDRVAIEEAAWSVPGVHTVDDRITVGTAR